MAMQLMTRAEVASYLHLKPSSVCTYMKQKDWDKIPPPIHFGNQYLWNSEVVENWLHERQMGGFDAKPVRNASV